MANYNKSFNFRNGVQVDDDNFIVNANGLVGIGTSIPTQILDVHGTTKVTGLVTTTNLAVTGTSNFYSNVDVGTAIKLNSSTGIVSATAFYGDGSNLLNVEQVAVAGWIVNAGSISTTAKVGIGSLIPSSQLDVLGDAKISGITTFTGLVDANGGATIDNIQIGVTGDNEIDTSSGNLTIDSAGGITTIDDNLIVTGSITGNVVGNLTGNIVGNVNSSGVSTFSGGIQSNVTGNVVGNVTGNVTGNVVGNLIGNVDGNLIGNVVGNVNSSGVSTFSGGIQSNVTGNVVGNVTGNVSGNLSGNVNSSGVSTFSGGILGNVTGNVIGNVIGSATSLTSTATVNINNLTVGVTTVSTRLYVEQIGVGTNSPSSDIHLRRSSTSTLQVTSDSAAAIVAVGRSTTLDGNNSALIFGNTAGIYPYSLGGNSLDVVNYGTGNLNAYLDYGTAGVGTGSFNWIYGQDPTNPLMSLTYNGNLGLGVTNSTNKLHVVGTSTITGNAFFGQNINVSGNTNISGNLNILGGGSLSVNLTGNVSGNVNSTVGFSTFNNINVTNNVSSFKSFIGIGTTGSDPSYQFQVSDQFFVSSSGIGIGTNVRLPNIYVSAIDANAVFKSVGIGTTVPQSALSVVGGTIISGVTTSLGGFTSGLFSNPVKITVSGNILTFTVPGVGATSLTLF